MSIKKWALPVALVVIFGGYIIYRQVSGSAAPAITKDQTSASKETINPGQTDTNQNPPPTATQTGYKDGQYTGQTANTIYGDVQVKVSISGGKITSIQMLKAPTGAGHTADLVASSFPILKSEAIASQSANVNVVSGATQNSEGFSQSLASALSLAS